LADPPAIKQPAPGAVCRIGHCDLWPQAADPFCHSHANTWRANGRPELDMFVAEFDEIGATEEQIIRLGGLGPQLRLEIQYALQCRHDQRTTKTFPAVVMALVRALATANANSLLELTEDEWRARIGRPTHSVMRSLLIYARRQVADLVEAGG
jgi:hypothetical protein